MQPQPSLAGQTPKEPLARRALEACLAMGTVVGGHVVREAVGRGGMADVYRATDERLGRDVALKVLPRDGADEEARARFLREARALARIDSSHVVRVFASGQDGELAWMAMAFVDGTPLGALLDGGPIDEETAVGLMAQVARGLAAVHSVGVVHRDIKPDNLLVDDDANVRIVDFGVALLQDTAPGAGGFATRAGVIVGTPHFMAPEQARGESADARTDLWAVGATLYALLTGQPPFARPDDGQLSDVEILARVVREPVPDVRALAPHTSSSTAALVARLLDKDPQRRPADPAAVAATLEAIADTLARGDVPDDPTAAPPPAPPVQNDADSVAAPPAASPEGSAADGVPRPGLGPGILAATLAAVLLAVVGGAAVGRFTAEPRVVEKVVERQVDKPVETRPEVPVAPPPATPSPTPVEPPPPPVAPPPPTADEEVAALVAAIRAGPAGRGPLHALVQREDEAAVAAVAALVRDPALAPRVVMAIGEARGLAHQALLAPALFGTDAEVARAALEALTLLKTDVAVEVLSRAAERHPDARLRDAARAARDTMFRVDE